MAAPTDGRKNDADKPRWDLLPLALLEPAVRVLTMGAVKYSPDNWKRVPDARARYYAALMRHMTAWQAGERVDPESGESHLAHAMCCLVFLTYFDRAPDCDVERTATLTGSDRPRQG